MDGDFICCLCGICAERGMKGNSGPEAKNSCESFHKVILLKAGRSRKVSGAVQKNTYKIKTVSDRKRPGRNLKRSPVQMEIPSHHGR